MYCADLHDLLCDLVPQLSSCDRDKLFRLVLKPDVLIVMANHAAIEVRIAVVKVCITLNMQIKSDLLIRF